MKVSISDLGATLVSWHAPDRTGRLGDILLGHDTPAEYLASTTYMGGLIGRWANRIAGARFTLDGIEYTLDRNEGNNLLHGGSTGFNRLHWEAAEDNGALVMRLESPEGDAGFPGHVTVQVRYTLDDDGTLTIAYEAITDAPTPLNLTSHPYFNLSGHAASDVRGHVVSIDAEAVFRSRRGNDSVPARRGRGQCVRLPAKRPTRRASRLAEFAARTRAGIRSLLCAARNIGKRRRARSRCARWHASTSRVADAS